MKKIIFLITLLLNLTIYSYGAGTIVTYVIDPVKNANDHNNKGVNYIEERDYYAAIQEFKIAISLNPKTQATSTYYNNLGKTYMSIGYPKLALDCFQRAISQYSLNFEYYQNLANCYYKLGQIRTQLSIYKNKTQSPLDRLMLGLLYERTGNIKKAIIIFDEITMTEPDLLITPAIKNHIKSLTSEID